MIKLKQQFSKMIIDCLKFKNNNPYILYNILEYEVLIYTIISISTLWDLIQKYFRYRFYTTFI